METVIRNRHVFVRKDDGSHRCIQCLLEMPPPPSKIEVCADPNNEYAKNVAKLT